MVVNARFVKPIDRALIASVAAIVPKIITVEENVLQGGFGSAVLEFLNELDTACCKSEAYRHPGYLYRAGNAG